MEKSSLEIAAAKPRVVEFLVAFATTSVIAGLSYPISHAIGYQTVGFLFLMSIPVLSIFIGRGPVLFAALLNFVVWNYFFIPPVMTFHITRLHDLIALFAYLGVAVSSGILVTRIRTNQLVLAKSQERIRLINSFLVSLNNAGSIRDVVRRTQEVMSKQFGAEIIVFLKEKEGSGLSRKAFGNTELFSEAEYDLALPVFEGNHVVLSGLQYYPLTVQRGNIGVIGIQFNELRNKDEETLLLVRSFAAQLTSALDREINIDIAKEKEIYMESQKLFQTVLNSVSHELRTPISIITAAVSTLDDENTAANPETRKLICAELNSAAQRLNVLVENILDMSKIDSGYFHLNRQICDTADLIGVAVNGMKSEFIHHNLRVNIAENLPPVSVDLHWFKQAIVNILHNSIFYTPAGSDIFIEAYTSEDGLVVLEILDSGTGVPEHSIKKLFEKFYRVPGSKSGGTGLGLTIAKAIVEAHKGIIFAKNREGGGLSVFIIIGKNGNE
ncbi:MAG: ATP-binding protein [Bacteroidales bacterium]|jgi:two-component system sensor histidine kinase KdpD